MTYVVAAYGIAMALIGGYAVSIFLRRREAQRALEAWREAPDGAQGRDAEPGDAR
jgi:hypothetical protein